MRFWIGVASREHVKLGEAGGFCQLGHGKAAPLKRMAPGDWIIYYSPKEKMEDAEALQMFTAIGEISDDKVYQHEMFPGFVPYRSNIRYLKSKDASIRPLIEKLSFIKDKSRWGYAFRFGHLEISKEDFDLIATEMVGKVLANVKGG